MRRIATSAALLATGAVIGVGGAYAATAITPSQTENGKTDPARAAGAPGVVGTPGVPGASGLPFVLDAARVRSADGPTRPAWFEGVRDSASTASQIASGFERCRSWITAAGWFCGHNAALKLTAAEALASLKAGNAANQGPCSAQLEALALWSTRTEREARSFSHAPPSASRVLVNIPATGATRAWAAVQRCLTK
jgi:hypothetical protein